MLSRREWLRITAGASAALGLNPRLLQGLQDGAVMTRPIPSSGEQVPVVGLGGRWISNRSTAEELADHRAVMHELARNAEGAGRLFDSAAGYLDIDGGFEGFRQFVNDLNASLGIPTSLSELGVSKPDLDRLVKDALSDPSTGGNPIEMTPENTRALYEKLL